MKHLIMLVCSMFVIVAAIADMDVCRKTGTAVILLSKSTDGQTMTSDSSNKTWSVTFNYTTLSVGARSETTMSGDAACNAISGTANTANTALIASVQDAGVNCWCEMWIPAHSYWTFAQAFASEAACASGCASQCATLVKTSSTFRTGMFSAIW